MNCLTEALGLALPGNGSVLATHQLRKGLFLKAGQKIVELTKQYYEDDDSSILPRSIANKKAFNNVMTMDIAMGGSTNTILHLLAAAYEAGVDFTMKDIDELSKKVPNICKIAPSSQYHMEDFHRGGGVMAVLSELDKEGLIDTSLPTVHSQTLAQALKDNDVATNKKAQQFYLAAPGGVRTTKAFSQNNFYESLDLDRENGVIRSIKHAYSEDGGLAILYGNIATSGSVIKTAGVDESLWVFKGRARVFESQDSAVEAILNNQIQTGDVVVIIYEGPKGGPGMQEMLYPTTFLKSKNLGKSCALITDGRFSGGTAGLSIGHISPEAASGGEIALVCEGDEIVIDIPNRSLNLNISESELRTRRKKASFKPSPRERKVSNALKAYAKMVSSADKGAVRLVD